MMLKGRKLMLILFYDAVHPEAGKYSPKDAQPLSKIHL